MKKIKHWIHSFHDTVMFKKTFPHLRIAISKTYIIKKKQKQRLAVSAFSTIY
jgi:hypothetical protein